MSIAESLLPEFDHEMENTLKVLERVPYDNPTWKPHEKSMTIAQLAHHVATLPGWAKETFTLDSLDMTGYKPPEPAANQAELLALFHKNSSAGREALANASDAAMFSNWSLTGGGVTYFTMPKIACYRGFVMNHVIHHRAQLIVYLRMNNIPVPGMYGPSADETNMM
jgi:uncharacterized damage-inducible protein DinB